MVGVAMSEKDDSESKVELPRFAEAQVWKLSYLSGVPKTEFKQNELSIRDSH